MNNNDCANYAIQRSSGRDLGLRLEDAMCTGSLVALLVVVDLVLFAHRMACTYSTVKVVLSGHVAYIECRPISTSCAAGLLYTTSVFLSVHNRPASYSRKKLPYLRIIHRCL